MPKDADAKARMARKIRSKAGSAIYAQRKAIVEPVNGQIKEARGLRRFLLRGLEKVDGEWHLIAATHKLLKLVQAQTIPAAGDGVGPRMRALAMEAIATRPAQPPAMNTTCKAVSLTRPSEVVSVGDMTLYSRQTPSSIHHCRKRTPRRMRQSGSA